MVRERRTIDDVPFFQSILRIDTNRLHVVHNRVSWRDDFGEMYLITLCGQRIWWVHMNSGLWQWKRWAEILEEFVRTSGKPEFSVCRSCGKSQDLEVVEGLIALIRGTSTRLRQVVENRKGEF